MMAVVPSHAQEGLGPDPIPGETFPAEASASMPEALPRDTGAPADNVPVAERPDARVVELRSVIEEALRKNPTEQVRHSQNARLDLLKQDLTESFWLPNLTLDFNVSNHRYDRVYTSTQSIPGTASSPSPGGSLGLTVEDYTVFNWGRDYLAYLNTKQNLLREHQRLVEARRRLRFQVIAQYFNLVRVKEFAKIKREQLRQASFIHRLAREKLQLRKVPAMEYYQTRAEFLRAQTEYQQGLFDVGQEEERMANLLGDEYRPAYRPMEQLRFTSVSTSPEEALRHALSTSPSFRDAKVAYETASRAYEKALKDNLPLPKFTLGVGTYAQQFGPDGNTWLRETPTGRDVEMVAAVNMRWTLTGEGGLFNSRVNKLAYLDKRITEIRFYNSKREVEVRLRTLLATLRFLEQKVAVADYQDKNARSNFDSTLNQYTTGRTPFPQIKLALDNWVLSEMNSENVKYEHLLRKLELAEVMGLDDLPGENFETLAVR